MNNIKEIQSTEQIPQDKLDTTLKNAEKILSKNYIYDLNKLQLAEIPYNLKNIKIEEKSRFIKINKLIYNKDESSIDKLTTIFDALYSSNATIVTIIDSDKYKVDYYIGIVDKSNLENISMKHEVLKGTFKGNFPGTEIEELQNEELLGLLDDIFDEDNNFTTSVSGIASLKLEEINDGKNYLQGLEKLVDSLRGKSYTAILIADPIQYDKVNYMKLGYEQLYSQISPYLKLDLSFNESDSLTFSEGITEGVSHTINSSLSSTQSYSESSGWSESEGSGESKTVNLGGIVSGALGIGGTALGALMGGPAGGVIGASLASSAGSIIGGAVGSTSTSQNTNTSKYKNTSESTSETHQEGKSISESYQSNISTSQGKTKGKNVQISYENRSIKSMIQQIDDQLKRIESCKNHGMFSFAAYFISDDQSVNNISANAYNSLMRGENSFIESSCINNWSDASVQEYIKKFTHPLFKYNLSDDESINLSPALIVSGKELAIHMQLPNKSISGLPVMNMSEFGRNVATYDNIKDKTINLGNIYHMGEKESTSVDINLNSLGMHTFITGSTGSGKSNTIYKLLNEVNKKGIKFLVIEPAKGEYKEVFGGRKDVSVFGTNPKFSEMLKINPFKFPEDIHILEHIDRLIEIFNACWPMYAAMPSVLKEAVEMSYERCGWDLDYSICASSKNIYPTFNDLLDNLNIVITNSAYSEELKSNYTGALCTRVKSLTNGLLGRIFTSNEIDNEILFDKNTIVDLSRIGSTETKSLITGILFIKLQECRMTSNIECNSKIRHITVLEEAHNLLRKTSNAQSQEGSNLQGKSVEMISNSIAEMRTYGEGFIIADQAPNLLDDSSIRNTNTKIILRLPQQEDRESVGRSASLNEDQINEIPKLKTGVAVVYQNNWMEPVLCQVDEFKDRSPLKYNFDVKAELKKDKEITGSLLKLLLNGRVSNDNKIDMGIERLDIDSKNEFLYSINEWLDSKDISNHIKDIINSNLEDFIKYKHIDLWDQDHFNDLCDVVNSFVDKNKMTMYSSSARNMNEWTTMSIEYIRNYIDLERNLDFEKSLLQCLLSSKSKEDEGFRNFYFKWVEDNRLEGGKII